MRITLQLVQYHSRQVIPCVVFTIDNQKYFFNVYDSFQRFYKEHSVNFLKGSKIFLSQLSSDHITGLYGVILSFEQQDLIDNTQIFGPPGFSSYLNSIRFLIGQRMLPFSFYDFHNNNEKILGAKSKEFIEGIFQRKDYNQIFFAMDQFLAQEQKTNPGVINDAQDFVKNESFYKDAFLEIHSILLGQKDKLKPSLCYLLKPNKVPGKVKAEKLKAHNIPSKMIGKLLEAEEVEINGTIYKSKDFKDPDSPSPLTLIIDCPTLLHLESLLQQENIKRLFADRIDLNEEDLKVMIHMVPSEVLCDSRYQDFLKNFPKSCQHIFANEDLKPTTLEFKADKVVAKQKKGKDAKGTEVVPDSRKNHIYRHFWLVNLLAQYFPDYFPTLDDLKPIAKYALEDLFPFLEKKITAQRMVEFIMAPTKNEGFSQIETSNKFTKFSDYQESDLFKKRYKKWLSISKEQTITEDNKALNLFTNSDPELVFLGTQSMMPSLCCNVSGIYLRFWQQENIGVLLDCGEGSYSQLLNHYGIEKTRELLKNLEVIFLTHIHADHHLGFLQLIRERDRILEEEKIKREPLFLVAPFNCGPWIVKYTKSVDKLNYRLVFSQHIKIETSKVHSESEIEQANTGVLLQERKEEAKLETPPEEAKGSEGDEEVYYEDPERHNFMADLEKESLTNVPDFEKFLLQKLGIIRFKAVDVEHCPQAYGVYIEHHDGWKFAYSGDTKPSDIMVAEIGNATILVHEATYEEDLKHMAAARLHATDKEAIEIGMRLKAWRTVLTHFSQRLIGKMDQTKDKTRNKDEFYKYSKNNVVRAWDHMRFRFSQLETLPVASRCLTSMFDGL